MVVVVATRRLLTLPTPLKGEQRGWHARSVRQPHLSVRVRELWGQTLDPFSFFTVNLFCSFVGFGGGQVSEPEGLECGGLTLGVDPTLSEDDRGQETVHEVRGLSPRKRDTEPRVPPGRTSRRQPTSADPLPEVGMFLVLSPRAGRRTWYRSSPPPSETNSSTTQGLDN